MSNWLILLPVHRTKAYVLNCAPQLLDKSIINVIVLIFNSSGPKMIFIEFRIWKKLPGTMNIRSQTRSDREQQKFTNIPQQWPLFNSRMCPWSKLYYFLIISRLMLELLIIRSVTSHNPKGTGHDSCHSWIGYRSSLVISMTALVQPWQTNFRSTCQTEEFKYCTWVKINEIVMV